MLPLTTGGSFHSCACAAPLLERWACNLLQRVRHAREELCPRSMRAVAHFDENSGKQRTRETQLWMGNGMHTAKGG